MGDSISAYYDKLEEDEWKQRKKEYKALLNYWLDNIGEFDTLVNKVGEAIQYVESEAVGTRHLHDVIEGLGNDFQALTTLPKKNDGKK